MHEYTYKISETKCLFSEHHKGLIMSLYIQEYLQIYVRAVV